MEGAVYVLCGMTAFICGVLLLRGYWRSKIRLLLWSALFFFASSAENSVLFVDLILMPQFDLALARNSVALVGMLLLMYGLTWEST